MGAFWSLTMYDVPNYYLVKNPIDRYSIGDRTTGLVYEADGSLVITIAHARPADATERANWLPAPAGEFSLMLRLYWPSEKDPSILDGSWTSPAVKKAG